MRYYTVLYDGKERVAASCDGHKLFVLDEFQDMQELIEAGGIEKILPGAKELPVDAQILSPIPRPKQDMICLGINYTEHASEADRFSREAFGGDRPYPIFFSKRVSYSQGSGGAIPAHTGLVDSLDYECELAVIIGKDALGMDRRVASDYIFGYTITNDVSARNVQTRHKQWYLGKSLDGFAPMGPCIVSADEFAFPPKLAISSKVNGELRQNSNTGNMITGIAESIELLSQGMLLKAGTIIATGTPSGVGMGMTPPCFLRPGDVVECEIEGIGRLVNTVKTM